MGNEGHVCVTTGGTCQGWVGGGDNDPGVSEDRGDGETDDPEDCDGGSEETVVATFGETVGDHVRMSRCLL